MQLSLVASFATVQQPLEQTPEALIVGVFQGEHTICAPFAEEANPILTPLLESSKTFKGKLSDVWVIPSLGRFSAPYIILVGLGAKDKFNAKALRRASAAGVRGAHRHQLTSAVSFLMGRSEALALCHQAQLLAEGAILGNYKFTLRKGKSGTESTLTESNPSTNNRDQNGSYAGLQSLSFYTPNPEAAIQNALTMGEIIAQATTQARNWVFDAANEVTPTFLAQQAMQMAANHPEVLSCTVMDAQDIQRLGMATFEHVSKGSEEPPAFIHLRYTPPPSVASSKTIALVGKGITFDSGGLSLKPASAMELMKMDMAGAAAVIATMGALGELANHPDLPTIAHNIEAFVPACENMPSGHAGRPGDIVTSLAGKTIEINNTDAEGRLVLADALTYAQRQCNPDVLIDLATLTGACVIALGKEAAAIMGTPDISQPLIDDLLKAANAAGEYLWQLPLYDEYKDCLKSEVADLINSGAKGEAGSSKGGVFLQAFVDKTRAWAHLDIAGPAYTGKDWPEVPKGATGYGVRTLLYYLLG
ncbi:MAG: leucyl aminopeptidase [Vampirovibrionales bacterium]|nr:leucyl aminopeptidase [Vampirovibrionales bacterium]